MVGCTCLGTAGKRERCEDEFSVYRTREIPICGGSGGGGRDESTNTLHNKTVGRAMCVVRGRSAILGVS